MVKEISEMDLGFVSINVFEEEEFVEEFRFFVVLGLLFDFIISVLNVIFSF